jgi:hypothetical protein
VDMNPAEAPHAQSMGQFQPGGSGSPITAKGQVARKSLSQLQLMSTLCASAAVGWTKPRAGLGIERRSPPSLHVVIVSENWPAKRQSQARLARGRGLVTPPMWQRSKRTRASEQMRRTDDAQHPTASCMQPRLPWDRWLNAEAASWHRATLQDGPPPAGGRPKQKIKCYVWQCRQRELHYTADCPVLMRLPLTQRWSIIRMLHLCEYRTASSIARGQFATTPGH